MASWDRMSAGSGCLSRARVVLVLGDFVFSGKRCPAISLPIHSHFFQEAGPWLFFLGGVIGIFYFCHFSSHSLGNLQLGSPKKTRPLAGDVPFGNGGCDDRAQFVLRWGMMTQRKLSEPLTTPGESSSLNSKVIMSSLRASRDARKNSGLKAIFSCGPS